MDWGTVVVAAVAAVGVIGGAWIQRRSNADTLRAAERREEALRTEARERRAEEREEALRRMAIEKEAREAEFARQEAASLGARRREHQDHWRQQRLDAHTKGLSAIDGLATVVTTSFFAGDVSPHNFKESIQGIRAVYPEIALYASSAALDAFENARSIAGAMQYQELKRLFALQSRPEDVYDKSEWIELKQRFKAAQSEYREKAKQDLGTDA